MFRNHFSYLGTYYVGTLQNSLKVVPTPKLNLYSRPKNAHLFNILRAIFELELLFTIRPNPFF